MREPLSMKAIKIPEQTVTRPRLVGELKGSR